MNILEKIIAHKKEEVAERKELYPIKLLEKSIYFDSDTVSLREYLLKKDKLGIIAEFKRKSPSKGDIQPYANPQEVTLGYMQAGASALSVLTDTSFFGGSSEDLQIARKFNFCPILRKDFIIDEYQLYEAKSIGADAVLLIAECLSPAQCEQLALKAKDLGLEVLLEVHNKENIETHYNDAVRIVGINNRDLKSFSVNLEHSIELASLLPKEVVKVAESGISSVENYLLLKNNGFDGFLIGEHFMRAARPHHRCEDFITEIQKTRTDEVG